MSGFPGVPTTPPAIIGGLQTNAFGQPFMAQSLQNIEVMQEILSAQPVVNGLPSTPFLGTQVVGGKFYHVDQFVENRMLGVVPTSTLEVSAIWFKVRLPCRVPDMMLNIYIHFSAVFYRKLRIS